MLNINELSPENLERIQQLLNKELVMWKHNKGRNPQHIHNIIETLKECDLMDDSNEMGEIYKLNSWVNGSKYRKKIMESLKDKEIKKTIDISWEQGLNQKTLTYSLNDMVNKGIVKCTTPDQRANREYKITKKGLKVLSTNYVNIDCLRFCDEPVGESKL